MDSSTDPVLQKFVHNLEELAKHYKLLLENVSGEKDLLIQADLEKINQNNSAKDILIQKIKLIDLSREKYARELALAIGANADAPRLLELATKLDLRSAEALKRIHATLESLVKKVSELNKENEEYAEGALRNLNGSLSEIKETLSGKKNYDKKGKLSQGPDKAGNFASKEA